MDHSTITVLAFLGLFSAPTTPEEANRHVEAKLDSMRLRYVCNGGDSGMYRAAKEAAARSVARFSPETTYTIKSVTNLDRALRNGTEKPEIDVSDCENLILEDKYKD